ncbi:MAG TPA: nucleotidyltransferase domain-containing protein [Geminicoccaceae bacterium]|nr:nucleotidyltransferase domain-containing protein [Geminicoccaceae bacterium]
MRLTPEAIAAIKRLVAETYGPEATVRLFGSRVDDARRGGDVDLLVELSEAGPPGLDPFWTPLRLRRRLEEALRGRKVDLLVHRSQELAPPIVEIARETGVRL